MAFEELREQLKDRAAEAMAKIQETSAYNTARERYESQTPAVQKAITLGGVGLAIFVVLMFPYSYISSGSESLTQFEENRELIQGLLRASRSAKEPAPLPPPVSPDTLKSSVDRVLRDAGLLPDQVGLIEGIPESVIKDLAPAGVIPTGVVARMKKLNLSQVIEIGNFLQNMGPGMKLLAAEVLQSAGTTHYYDYTVQIVQFGLPTFNESEPEAPAKGAKKASAKPMGGDEE